ncbi:MAG: diguanylate cyclase [Bacillota bacterium]|nr:diguanylate cyclase [Bacillota bacterium]
MEHLSKNDFFLIFKGIFNTEGYFEDYILTKTSENFHKVSGINPNEILGEKISKIAADDINKINLREIQKHMVPNTQRKYERYLKDLDKIYFINIFSDDRDYLIIFYTDITKYKKELEKTRSKLERSKGEVVDFTKKALTRYKDSLTGLYNREFFYEELKRLNTKRQLPISLIMGDLNGLKLINDAFGHTMGDKTLKRIGEILKETFRDEDIIARVGGDEFMILLPKTDKKTAEKILERVRQKCEEKPLEIININISFGTSTKTKPKENINELLEEAEDKMYFNKLKEGKQAKLSMINYLKEKLQKITFENKAHYERLKIMGMEIADILNFTEVEEEELKLLCEYHDIGKIGVPKKILQKKTKLTQKEWESMKKHSEIGYNIIKESREIISIDELILQHHERWDGKGYPGLLKGKEIPVVVRVFSVIDAYDAMVNERPYKEQMTKEEALKEIKNKAGSQFDPQITKIFIELMKKSHIDKVM